MIRHPSKVKYKIILRNRSVTECNSSQFFYIDENTVVPAHKLKIGNSVVTKDGTSIVTDVIQMWQQCATYHPIVNSFDGMFYLHNGVLLK